MRHSSQRICWPAAATYDRYKNCRAYILSTTQRYTAVNTEKLLHAIKQRIRAPAENCPTFVEWSFISTERLFEMPRAYPRHVLCTPNARFGRLKGRIYVRPSFFEKDEPVGPRMRRTINMARMRAARISLRYLGKVRSKTVSFPRNQGETCDMITMPMARRECLAGSAERGRCTESECPTDDCEHECLGAPPSAICGSAGHPPPEPLLSPLRHRRMAMTGSRDIPPSRQIR